MKALKELENTLLDQIEKLNDDTIASDPEEARLMIERSKAIGDLAQKVTEINKLKLDVIKEANQNGGLYEKFLGITDK